MQSPPDRADLEVRGFWAHACASQIPLRSKMRPPALFVGTETCLFLPCLSTGMCQGSLQAKSCQKFPSWGLGAGPRVTLRCIDRMQNGTSAESGLADCIRAVKHCWFLKIHITFIFYFKQILYHLSKKHSTSVKADSIPSKHLVGYCDSNDHKTD